MDNENKGLVTLGLGASAILIGVSVWGINKILSMQSLYGLFIIIVPLLLLGVLFLFLSIKTIINAKNKIKQKRKHEERMTFGRLLALLGGPALFVGCAFLNNIIALAGMITGAIIFIIGVRWIKIVKPIQIARAMKVTSPYVSYNEKYELLTVKQRNPLISKIVKVAADIDISIDHEEEKIHIGAATVGGVTTGGVYKTGDYDYISGVSNNGRYKLEFAGKFIHKIQLADELVKEIENTKIKIYLTEKENQILIGHTSEDKCLEIMEWLTSSK